MRNITRAMSHVLGEEASVPHMYLDTKGNVTIGIGHLVGNADAAKRLPLVNRATRRPATLPEIEAEFLSVSQQPRGRLAVGYKQCTTLELPPHEITALCRADLETFEKELRRNFPAFDSFPGDAQLALVDMAFNMGTPTLVNGFPHLVQAVRRQDWATCAVECHRKDIGAQRNLRTAALFRAAEESTRPAPGAQTSLGTVRA